MSVNSNFRCPKCNSGYVRSIDNEPLCHPTKKDVAVDKVAPIDLEIYYTCSCDDCNHTFKIVGDIVLRPVTK